MSDRVGPHPHGTTGEVEVDGTKVPMRFIEDEQRIRVYYERILEDKFDDHDKLLNTLDNFAKQADGYGNKRVFYYADRSKEPIQ